MHYSKKNARRVTQDARRFLITAGPTREYIDPVRYLSNDSSGLMGFALAKTAAWMGHRVTLITGPVALSTPKGVKRIDIVSAREMRREVMRLAPRADIIIMAAAVADWRPARFSKWKIKRPLVSSPALSGIEGSPRPLVLKENPDILAELGRKKRLGQILVGFALETGNLGKRAREKLSRKRCDWIIANKTSAIGLESARAILFSRNGKRIPLPYQTKSGLSLHILRCILRGIKNTPRT